MTTDERVLADRFYRILEGMLFLAVNEMQDGPRRESNREAFLELMEDVSNS